MKIKLGVFFGGKSVEHEVSIITAIQAIENMDKEKYDIIPIYITKDNKMYCGEQIGDIKCYKNIDELLSSSTQVTLAQKDNKVCLIRCDKKMFENIVYDYIDIAFPIVHGTNVEDGTLQGFLKMFNLPYVGCDVTSSAVGMDKYIFKCLLKDNDIPIINCKCYTADQYNADLNGIIKSIEESINYPVIVKPVNLGSSVGIKIAKDRAALEDAIANAFTYAKKVLVERAVMNLKEVNCSVVGDYEECEASECEEPVKTDEILSFNDKYISGGKKMGVKSDNEKSMNAGVLKLPAEISPEMRAKIQDLSKRTFKVLGCTGVVRIDFIIDQDTNDVFVNEINTIPGSLSFHLWKATGVKYSNHLDKMINLALKRNREEQNMTFSFDSNILAGYENGFGGTKGKLGK
ncbi:MAG: D-alanine--D-alanine ligase [Clostridia bacterium]|nr:D-alanine--D-alanine ligase [Clostridia bacterium]